VEGHADEDGHEQLKEQAFLAATYARGGYWDNLLVILSEALGMT